MKRPRKKLLAGVLGLAVLGVLLVATLVAWPDEEPVVEIAGMELTQADVDEMVQDSMGADALNDVPLVKLEDRADQLEGEVDGEVREFELEAKPIRWEYRDRQSIAAWGYEGQVPGPTITATEGEKLRIKFTNRLPEATTVHWHGVDLPFTEDGVPGVTQEPIEPGDTYTYEFEARPAGTRFYHTHGSSMRDEARQLDMGLAGPLIIEPATAAPAKQSPPDDRRETLVLDEWSVASGGLNAAMMSGAGHAAHNAGFNLFTINGRAAPDTSKIAVEKGDVVRIRFINAGTSTTHPMHLHGHQFTVTAIDGNPVPVIARQRRNVIPVAPGETYDVTFTANNPGVWMLHCHELHHADAGMMTLVQYDGFEPVDEFGGGHDESVESQSEDEAGEHSE